MAYENVPENKRSFYAAIPQIGLPIGFGLSSILIAVPTLLLPEDIFFTWGWRIPFLAAIILTVIVIRQKGEMMETEDYMAMQYDYIKKSLPEQITFVTTQELEDRYPDKTPKEREYEAVKEYGAVFLMQIGDKLASGEPHDGRAPDYDDWSLNGDIIVYYPVLDMAFEISSMGIRVDEKALKEQLEKAGCSERENLPFQKEILEKKLQYTIGGGI